MRLHSDRMSAVWELVFMMLILKLPVAYVAGVVYWAIRAEPRPPQPAALVPVETLEPAAPWSRRRRRPRDGRGPHGGPTRGFSRGAGVARRAARA